MTNNLGSSFSLLVARAILKSQLPPRTTVELQKLFNINNLVLTDLHLEIHKATLEGPVSFLPLSITPYIIVLLAAASLSLLSKETRKC